MTDAEILDRLEERLRSSLRFRDGQVLGSMCTEPDPLAVEVMRRTYDLNAGDPGLAPALVELEREVVSVLGGFWRRPGAEGNLVSGGTEANILALWAARSTRRSDRQDEVVVSEARHFSIDKAAQLLGLRLTTVACDSWGRVDLDRLRRRLSHRTLALVGVAGSTSLGAVDDLRELGRLAAERELYLHVDASFGGLVLPFLEEAGYPAPDFGLDLEGVGSVCLDPHKMGRGPIPAGCILWKDPRHPRALSQEVSYLSGGRTRLQTLTGTRPGASVAAVWAVLQKLGRRGYVEEVRRALGLAHWFTAELGRIEGVEPVQAPVLNVVGVRPRAVAAGPLAERLRADGWALSVWPDFLRVVIMPHVDRPHLERFLDRLRWHLSREVTDAPQ